jgi:hypothetical protein
VAKVGVVAPVAVVLSRMEAVPLLKFATAKSGFVVQVEVADADGFGVSASREVNLVAKVGVVAPVAVVLSRMETLPLLFLFATAKSGFLSPLKSPMLTEKGLCQ